MHNCNWLQDIKVVIFDMDGTLYQDDTFMDRYIRYALEGTGMESLADEAVALGRDILAGTHAFRCGHFYHRRENVVFIRKEGRFVEGLTWEGTALDHPDLSHSDQERFMVPSDMIHIGDPWGIATVVALKYGQSETGIRSAFDRVRREMIVEPHRFPYHQELFRAIEALDAVERKVVMTNTHLESGIAFLDYMNIRHLFDEVYCGAEKPNGIHRYCAKLLESGFEAREILSIGDNTWNDLHPVKRLGGRTCLMTPYSSSDSEQWDLRLTTLDELEQLMREIQQQKKGRQSANGGHRTEKHKQEV